MELKEELLKKLTAQVQERVEQIKAEGGNPGEDVTVKRIVDEISKTVVERKGDFADEPGVETPVSAGRFDDKAKMLMPKKQLSRYYNPDTVQALEEFKELQDDLYIVGNLLAGKTNQSYFEAVKQTRIYRNLQDRLHSDKVLQKALAAATTGSGAEWIPTGFSNQLLEKIRLQLKVAQSFQLINMPTNPFNFPVQSSVATGYLIAESTADAATKITASTPGTSNFSFSAKKLAGRVLFSEEINEDAAIGMLDFVRAELAIAIAEALEKAILDGDVSATHQDSDVTASTDARKAFSGLRYFALNNAGTATSSFSNAAPTTALLRGVRKLMGKYGALPTNLIWFVSPATSIQMLNITEVQTVDKFGPSATILTGQIGNFDGIPVVVSEHIREDLNASGVYDATTTDRTVVHLVDKRGFWIGQRGGVTINTIRDFETDQVILVAKHRVSFKDPYDATSASFIQSVLGINVAT